MKPMTLSLHQISVKPPMGGATLQAYPKLEKYYTVKFHRVVRQNGLRAFANPEDKEESSMRSTKVALIALVIFTIVMGGLFAGCGGGGARVEQSSTTLGQELTDLQGAYNKGIITEKEYEKAKKNLLKKYK